MRKHSNKRTKKAAEPQRSVGLDLGDRNSHYAIVDQDGKLVSHGGPARRKRAVTALARKLAVVLHQLWIREDHWRPFPADA